MDYTKLRGSLKGKLFFGVEELQGMLGIKPASVRVLCSRYAKKGLFIRLKRNFYTLSDQWDYLTKEKLFKMANAMQVPSYVSFMTALSFYELTTQVQKDFCESASLRRSARHTVKGVSFNYYKLKKPYYFDFINLNGVFIATKEKAFVDTLYMHSFGKHNSDLGSISVKHLNRAKINKLLKIYPAKTRELARKICKIS